MLQSTNLAVNIAPREGDAGAGDAGAERAMPKPVKTFQHSPDYVQSLARGLMVLRSFDAEQANPSLAEVAARTDRKSVV